MIKTFLKALFSVVLLLLVIILGVNFWVIISTKDKIYYDPELIPSRKVAVILGTSKRVAGGSNIYFKERVEAAARLYHRGKIKHIIVSGDNRSVYYNEPRDMYDALIKLGVPGKSITMDYAGLRTLDSIVRAKVIFGQEDIIIITQDFHCYRALFIAHFNEMNAIAYAAGDEHTYSIELAFRELIARNLAAIDLYIIQSAPTHLGKEQLIP